MTGLDYLVTQRILYSPQLKAAFSAVDRAWFVPAQYHARAYEDVPLPIGEGQTISQPSTVAFMLELLELASGQQVLDIGTGSGWTTALMAHAVSPDGTVLGIERIPELVTLGQGNLRAAGSEHATIREARALGAPEEAPFDRILVSAAARNLPATLVEQLKVGGILVMPVRHMIVKVTRRTTDHLIERHDGFVFVPLITDEGISVE